MNLGGRQTAPPGLLISAAASGTGKTTVTLGLARALCQRGLKVQAFKCGPDYIDTAFHQAASGRPCFNLDSWAMPSAMIAGVHAHAAGTDLVLAEGAMGLFDGAIRRGECGNGSSADIAAMMGWPVVLVIDCARSAQTVAAVAAGLAHFRKDTRVAGVILNRVASARHASLIRAGFEHTGLTVFGALPRRAEISLPERHLGLVQAEEATGLDHVLDGMAQLVHENTDLDLLVRTAVPAARSRDPMRALTPPGQRIALARDAAFSFVYQHMLAAWRAAGAEVIPFSPLADEGPANDADVCWLPGGYPELHAGRLSVATRFRANLRHFAETRPVHGECGGYMALGDALIDAEGQTHPMAGLLRLTTSFKTRRLHLGYRAAQLLCPLPGYAAGRRLRGHEFHYATIMNAGGEPLAAVEDAAGEQVAEQGARIGLVTGTFFHLIAEAA